MIQMDVDLYFINYANAFDKVQHKEMFELLGNLDLFRNDIRIIQNSEQTACIWKEN